MKNEIDRDFYCSASKWDSTHDSDCCLAEKLLKWHVRCSNCHRKYPSLKQFKEEYGEEYSYDGAVWWRWWFWNDQKCTEGGWEDWQLCQFRELPMATKTGDPDKIQIVCACTPYGEPPQDWRP